MTQDWAAVQKATYCDKGYGETKRALTQERFIKTLGMLRPHSRVLDLGCNDGSFTQLLQDKGFEVTGADFGEIIQKAQEEHPKCHFIATNIDSVDFLEKSFDAVIALGLIEHLVGDIEFMRKAYRWLTPNGRIFLSTPLSPEKICEEDSTHIRFYPPYSLLRLLEVCEFKISRIDIFREVDEYLIIGEKAGEKSGIV